MDPDVYLNPRRLEKAAFLWSSARMVLAALALFLGGVPAIVYFFRVAPLYGLITLGLKLAWIVSGAASIYLFYTWHANGQTLFGGKDTRDRYLFFVFIVSGINTGVAGILGVNFGMRLSSAYVIFLIVAALYVYATYHLVTKWKANNERLFDSGPLAHE